jgi:hypothetical protein
MQNNLDAVYYIVRLNHILRTFAHIKYLLCSERYNGFELPDRLSYHIENFYIRVYFFREGFYLMINKTFGLNIKEGESTFRKQIYEKVKSDKDLSFLLPALEELKKNEDIKKCLKHWRTIEHNSLIGYDFYGHKARLAVLKGAELSPVEEAKIVNKMLKQTTNDIEIITSALTTFLEKYSEKILKKLL